MNLPAVIEVALGLVVLYLLLSTLCSMLVELLSTSLGWRRTLLQDSINRLLTGDDAGASSNAGTVTAFWEHPLVKPLIPPGKDAPSYLESSTFAAVVIDIGLPKDPDGAMPSTPGSIERALARAAGGAPGTAHRQLAQQLATLHRVRELLALKAPTRTDTLGALQNAIALWYDEAMDRLTGQYKRQSSHWLLGLGAGVALLLNADSIRLAYVLSTDEPLRTSIAIYATTLAGTNDLGGATSFVIPPNPVRPVVSAPVRTNAVPTAAPVGPGSTNELQTFRVDLANQIRELQKVQAMGFPIGWQLNAAVDFAPVLSRAAHSGPGWGFLAVLLKLIGLATTALAVSLGAPFWYDILNKLVSLRGAGRRPPTASETNASDSPVAGSSQTTKTVSGPPANAASAGVAARAASPMDIGKDLAQPEVSFSIRKGYWLAEASRLAYERDFAVVQREVRERWFFDDVVPFDDGRSTQALLITGPKVAILAFRGTEPKQIEDWLTDARFSPKPWDSGLGEVHTGFAGALEGVYPEIVARIEALRGSGRLLYLTGHSLGAALATLMATRLAARQVYPVQGVYTYGSPRTGNPEFADAYTRLVGDRTHRFVNNEDLVTRVPPRAFGLKHVGGLAYFDADGRLHQDIGFWYRFLNTVANAVEDFQQEVKTTVADHDKGLYVRRCRDLSDPA